MMIDNDDKYCPLTQHTCRGEECVLWDTDEDDCVVVLLAAMAIGFAQGFAERLIAKSQSEQLDK